MALHGKGGNLSVAAADLVNLQTYALTRTGETAETSSMGDDWATFINGLTDFTGTAEGKSQIGLDTVALLGSAGSAVFSGANTGISYTGGVIISGITETATVDADITISYSLEGNDAAGLVFNASTGAAASGSSNAIHGKGIDAELATGTSFTDITGWTFTGTVPVADTTVAHSLNCGRTKIAGIKTATATVTVLTPTTDLQVLEGVTAPQLNLWRAEATAATGYYTGAAICTGHEQGVDVTGAETTTYSFVYTGVVDLVLL